MNQRWSDVSVWTSRRASDPPTLELRAGGDTRLCGCVESHRGTCASLWSRVVSPCHRSASLCFGFLSDCFMWLFVAVFAFLCCHFAFFAPVLCLFFFSSIFEKLFCIFFGAIFSYFWLFFLFLCGHFAPVLHLFLLVCVSVWLLGSLRTHLAFLSSCFRFLCNQFEFLWSCFASLGTHVSSLCGQF